MNPIPISVQLYSLREEAKADFPAVLKAVADMGYIGVEPAGLHGMKPEDVRKILDDLGLVASSAHGPFPNADNVNELVDTAKALGHTRHIAGVSPDDCATLETTLEAAKRVRAATELLAGTGITFGLHNHWWEFDKDFDGKLPMDVIMENAPDAFAEVDTYWVAVGGADTAAVVKKLGSRAPLLHIKDGPMNREEAMVAVGAGGMDWSAVVGAAEGSAEWLVVELDRCDTDMTKAVAESYTYLTSNGFAKGRK
jgi:sugar phosphate isomerase/epimerase